jgi:hypothetical protein
MKATALRRSELRKPIDSTTLDTVAKMVFYRKAATNRAAEGIRYLRALIYPDPSQTYSLDDTRLLLLNLLLLARPTGNAKFWQLRMQLRRLLIRLLRSL